MVGEEQMIMQSLQRLGELLPRDVISLRGLGRAAIEAVFRAAQCLERAAAASYARTLKGKIGVVMFYQPSTRTRLNFESAILRLGGAVTGFADAKTTRAGDYYQESLDDVIRFSGELGDILVLRHFDTGAAQRAAAMSPVPLISAGDGYNEHPTQGLGDLWTMHKLLGGLDGATIALVGDANIRSLKSIIFGLAAFRPRKLILVPPPLKEVPKVTADSLNDAGIPWEIGDDVNGLVSTVDLIETIGIRHPNHNAPIDQSKDEKATPERYRLKRAAFEKSGRAAWILHPGPRSDEIENAIDALPQARYFEQARNGLFVRMALIGAMLSR